MNFQFERFKQHIGHKIVCVSYGPKRDMVSVAIECVNCSEVLVDCDNVDLCPACGSDDLSNEGPENDDKTIDLTCHNCSNQWNEAL